MDIDKDFQAELESGVLLILRSFIVISIMFRRFGGTESVFASKEWLPTFCIFGPNIKKITMYML